MPRHPPEQNEAGPGPPAEAAAPSPAQPAPPRRRPLLAWLAPVGLLGLLGLTLLTRVARTATILQAAVATALPAIWVLGVGLLLLMLLLWRRDRLVRLAALTGVLCWLAIWGRVWAAFPAVVGSEGVRVLSWNVQRLAFEEDPEGPALQCVVDALERLSPDVLALQEVTAEDLDRLSRKLPLSCVHTDYQGTGRSDRGGLAACVLGERVDLRRGWTPRFTPDRAWYYAFAELAVDGRVFNLMSVHLHPYGRYVGRLPNEVPRVQNDEAQALLRRVEGFEDPTLLAGDFNSPRDAGLHVAIRGHMRDAFERGGWGPGPTVHALGFLPLRVDYLYATLGWRVGPVSIDGAECADHRAIVGELGLPR